MKPKNILRTAGEVSTAEREARQGHKGAVVWLTGLSGSGKTTISCALERALFDLGLQVYILDGDNIRHGLNAKLGFSREDREENIRRVAEVATLIADIGVVAIAAFISPYREDRRRAREIAQAAGKEFIEVYLDAPVEVCEQRDVKGLYKRARAGEIAEFTGISAPYEEPLAAEVVIDTDRASVSAAVAQLLAFLRPRLRLTTDEE
jgi:adenylylsulfate kinase